jgi:hypothetical protein
MSKHIIKNPGLWLLLFLVFVSPEIFAQDKSLPEYFGLTWKDVITFAVYWCWRNCNLRLDNIHEREIKIGWTPEHNLKKIRSSPSSSPDSQGKTVVMKT